MGASLGGGGSPKLWGFFIPYRVSKNPPYPMVSSLKGQRKISLTNGKEISD